MSFQFEVLSTVTITHSRQGLLPILIVGVVGVNILPENYGNATDKRRYDMISKVYVVHTERPELLATFMKDVNIELVPPQEGVEYPLSWRFDGILPVYTLT